VPVGVVGLPIGVVPVGVVGLPVGVVPVGLPVGVVPVGVVGVVGAPVADEFRFKLYAYHAVRSHISFLQTSNTKQK
jgi:hypothetical protein